VSNRLSLADQSRTCESHDDTCHCEDQTSCQQHFVTHVQSIECSAETNFTERVHVIGVECCHRGARTTCQKCQFTNGARGHVFTISGESEGDTEAFRSFTERQQHGHVEAPLFVHERDVRACHVVHDDLFLEVVRTRRITRSTSHAD
jgi:hypothetical protein